MKRTLILLLILMALVGCSKQSAAPAPETSTAQPPPAMTPAASPGALAVAPTLATPVPTGSVAPPIVAPKGKEDSKQAQAEQKPLPPDLWQRMTRPLTLEEINKLPPETRDMILRAQGRLPASPAPKKK